jgi:hypothetical protein
MSRSADDSPIAPLNGCFQNLVPDYALLFFDHLYSEYLTLRQTIADPGRLELLDSLQQKRANSKLTWSDIYTFDLALVDTRPLENLIRKAYDARARYRSIAGQKEYDEYLASKPPDLTAILIAPNNSQPAGAAAPADAPDPPPQNMPQSAQIIQRILRADIRYLLSKFYLYYAMLPMREGLREQLTTRAVRMTKWILGTIVVLMVLSFSGGVLLRQFTSYGGFFWAIGETLGAFGPMVGSVAFAGIIGGCISMLQRIQSAPSEGDALFNLAALTNGWRGLSLSPLYGGIFASLLFILFAAGLLQGSAFPRIETRNSAQVAATEQEKTTDSETPAAPSRTTVSYWQLTNVADSTPAAADSSTKNPPHAGVLRIKDFLRDTGPQDGVSFALLMIWSFIAGFAERLVPDTLNRLVAKNEAIQGTNT